MVYLVVIVFVGYVDVGVFYDVNVLGMMNLLDVLVCVLKCLVVVLLVSSVNIYGNCDVLLIGES